MKKDLEREKVLDQIHDLEQVLVGLGHMRAKKRLGKCRILKSRIRKMTMKSLSIKLI